MLTATHSKQTICYEFGRSVWTFRVVFPRGTPSPSRSPRSLSTSRYLVRHAGRAVSREKLLDASGRSRRERRKPDAGRLRRATGARRTGRRARASSRRCRASGIDSRRTCARFRVPRSRARPLRSPPRSPRPRRTPRRTVSRAASRAVRSLSSSSSSRPLWLPCAGRGEAGGASRPRRLRASSRSCAR